MNPTNLYDIYKQVKQRTRTPKSAETERKAEAMIAAAEHIVTPTATPRSRLVLVEKFRKAEELWCASYDVSASTKSMADQFKAAICSKNFVVKMWPGNKLATGYNPVSGLVYCVRDASKPGQLKIGVTTMKLRARLQKMQTRYGYENIQPLFVINVSKPAEIEHHAQEKLRGCRVTGMTKGDSVEWYHTNAIEFARAVVDTVEERGNSVAEVKLFADCPNANNVKVALNRLGVDVNRESWL